MDTRRIKALAKIMDSERLSAIELQEGDTKIRLERNFPRVYEKPAAKGDTKPLIDTEIKGVVDYNNIVEITSPMIGVFYAAPSPDSPPFVRVGSKVKKGDVLCIIEAMKLMNEITSEVDGEIAEICVENGQVVEYSQVLFRIF